jgi:hypothetical protein
VTTQRPVVYAAAANHRKHVQILDRCFSCVLQSAYISTLASRDNILLTRYPAEFLLFHGIFLAFVKNIMHKADQPCIANQQCWRKWDYLAAVVDGDAVVDAKQQDTRTECLQGKKEMLRTKFTLGR